MAAKKGLSRSRASRSQTPRSGDSQNVQSKIGIPGIFPIHQ